MENRVNGLDSPFGIMKSHENHQKNPSHWAKPTASKLAFVASGICPVASTKRGARALAVRWASSGSTELKGSKDWSCSNWRWFFGGEGNVKMGV